MADKKLFLGIWFKLNGKTIIHKSDFVLIYRIEFSNNLKILDLFFNSRYSKQKSFTMNQPSPSRGDDTVATATVNINLPNQPPHSMKVNVDCWEKISDYLSLADILAIMQTCVRMHEMVNYYCRLNFKRFTSYNSILRNNRFDQ